MWRDNPTLWTPSVANLNLSARLGPARRFEASRHERTWLPVRYLQSQTAKNDAKKGDPMKKKNAVKKVGSKKKPAATRIVPVYMKSGKSRLRSKDVEGQSELGDAIRRRFEPRPPSWACAAVRG
jgi:hypothetical protein